MGIKEQGKSKIIYPDGLLSPIKNTIHEPNKAAGHDPQVNKI